MESIKQYQILVHNLDILCQQIAVTHQEQLACHAGCDTCCQHITLFRVEAYALATAVSTLEESRAAAIRDRARGTRADDPCPLLVNHRCLLYEARPIICRTHGLPLLATRRSTKEIDFCPKNFQGVASLPGSSVIDLETLNTALAGVNALFCVEYFNGSPPAQERLTIAEAILHGSDQIDCE